MASFKHIYTLAVEHKRNRDPRGAMQQRPISALPMASQYVMRQTPYSTTTVSSLARLPASLPPAALPADPRPIPQSQGVICSQGWAHSCPNGLCHTHDHLHRPEDSEPLGNQHIQLCRCRSCENLFTLDYSASVDEAPEYLNKIEFYPRLVSSSLVPGLYLYPRPLSAVRSEIIRFDQALKSSRASGWVIVPVISSSSCQFTFRGVEWPLLSQFRPRAITYLPVMLRALSGLTCRQVFSLQSILRLPLPLLFRGTGQIGQMSLYQAIWSGILFLVCRTSPELAESSKELYEFE